MELVEEHFLPVLGDLSARIALAVEPGERCPLLRIQNLHFRVAHVALVIGLRGEDAAMIFEIEIARPRRNRNLAGNCGRRRVALGDGLVVPRRALRRNLLFNRSEERLRETEFVFGNDVVFAIGGFALPVEAFVEDGAGGSAAVVADAVEVHHLGRAGRELAPLHQVVGLAQRAQIRAQPRREIREYL